MTSEAYADIHQKNKQKIRRITRKYRREVLIAGLLLLALAYKGHILPRKSTIHCDDVTITRIFSSETIPPSVLITFTLLVPFVWILFFELLYLHLIGHPRATKKGFSLSWQFFLDIFVGGLFSLLIVEVLKLCVGEPRPHFWQTCRPNISQELCNGYMTVTWEDCTNPLNVTKGKLADTMKSFPSGHACLGIYTAIYMIIFIHSRNYRIPSKFLSPLFQIAWLTWGIVCGLSRIWDNKHHWWDVAAGSVIGLVFGFLAVIYLSNWFVEIKVVPESCEEEVTTPPNLRRNVTFQTVNGSSKVAFESNELTDISTPR